jgi:hypothetical protein
MASAATLNASTLGGKHACALIADPVRRKRAASIGFCAP